LETVRVFARPPPGTMFAAEARVVVSKTVVHLIDSGIRLGIEN
jgi:hypothetical protein